MLASAALLLALSPGAASGDMLQLDATCAFLPDLLWPDDRDLDGIEDDFDNCPSLSNVAQR